MKERPILFNGEMVRAILEGRKTQTRRPIKLPKITIFDSPNFKVGDGHSGYGLYAFEDEYPEEGFVFVCKSPFGKPGDRLWVRETHKVKPGYEPNKMLINYRADDNPHRWTIKDHKCPIFFGSNESHWRPSLHMRRECSRINLEITDVRVERVQNISDGDMYREGIMPDEEGSTFNRTGSYDINKWKELWNSVYKTWADNPWVWVVEFRRVE